MQLPGMSSDLVRVSMDVTWDPVADEFSLSRRVWTRNHRATEWQLETMATSASPIPRTSLPERWGAGSAETLRLLLEIVDTLTEPF